MDEERQLALFAEIPCAMICFYVARRIIGLFEASIPVLREAGFRLSGGRLTPPPADAAVPAVPGESSEH